MFFQLLSLTYLVKSVSCLTFYLVKSSKSTRQFLMYGSLYSRMCVCGRSRNSQGAPRNLFVCYVQYMLEIFKGIL